MALKASVVIPTYNGAERINIPLLGLLAQDMPDASFEVLVVDNMSDDGTSQSAAMNSALEALRRRGIQCRILTETRRGTTFARIRGVKEAHAEIVCFLDDDVLPEPAYLKEGIAAFSDPTVGLLVSRIYPRYQTEPTASITKREHLLAINHKLGDKRLEWVSSASLAPTAGAGMWVRREAFLSAVPRDPQALLPDRKGNSLLSSGDIEIGLLIGKAGYKRVYLPELRLLHFLPMTRLKSCYFCRLITGIVRGSITLELRYALKPYGTRDRVLALARLALALLASPVLLLRKDGFRETLFVLASRWAQLKGPHSPAQLGAEETAETAGA